MAAAKRKSWVEKRNQANPAHIEVLEKDWSDMKAGDRMLIANPALVDAYVRQISKGKEGTMLQMRKDLAADQGADNCCPLTSGIFLRIVAEAAYEEYEAGKPLKQIAPFWRIINLKSTTAKKLSFGTAFLKEQRLKEGLDKK